jgi:hypothetical protein
MTLPFRCNPLCILDVLLLAGLVATAEQQDEPSTLLEVVDPVTRTVGDAELGDPLADRLDVAGVAGDETIDPHLHSRSSSPILQFA